MNVGIKIIPSFLESGNKNKEYSFFMGIFLDFGNFGFFKETIFSLIFKFLILSYRALDFVFLPNGPS